MLDETTLEQRLITLERAVSHQQRKVEKKPSADNWLQKLTGSISDESAFLEALEYGRTFRQVDQPLDDSDRLS